MALGVALFIHAGRRHEWVYFLSVIWAIFAIAVKNWGDVWIVVGAAGVGVVVLSMALVRSIVGRTRHGVDAAA